MAATLALPHCRPLALAATRAPTFPASAGRSSCCDHRPCRISRTGVAEATGLFGRAWAYLRLAYRPRCPACRPRWQQPHLQLCRMMLHALPSRVSTSTIQPDSKTGFTATTCVPGADRTRRATKCPPHAILATPHAGESWQFAGGGIRRQVLP